MATSPAMAYWVSGMRIPPFVSATERVCQPRTGSMMLRCPTLWAASSDPDDSRRTSRRSTRTLDLALPAGQRRGLQHLLSRARAHIARSALVLPRAPTAQNTVPIGSPAAGWAAPSRSSAWVGTRNVEELPDRRAHDDTGSDLGIQSLEAVVRAPARAALTDFRETRSGVPAASMPYWTTSASVTSHHARCGSAG